jgi:cytochrome c556
MSKPFLTGLLCCPPLPCSLPAAKPEDTHPGQPVKQRQQAFKEIIKSFEPMGVMLRKGLVRARPLPRFRRKSCTPRATCRGATLARTPITRQARPGPSCGSSRNNSKPDKQAFLQASEALLAAAASKDKARIQPAYDAVHESCKACHDRFKAPLRKAPAMLRNHRTEAAARSCRRRLAPGHLPTLGHRRQASCSISRFSAAVFDAAKKSSDFADLPPLDCALRDEARRPAPAGRRPACRPDADTSYKFVAHAPDNLAERPFIIGMGPCGFMAGLLLAQMGFRPIILERGKIVRQRTKDTWDLWRRHNLHPESNVQFGEGGAGTFSDGKLYSQIKDPQFHGRKVLEEFVKAGAPPEEISSTSASRTSVHFRLVRCVEKSPPPESPNWAAKIRFESKVRAPC